MAQIETASAELAWIQKHFFKGAGLDKASRLEGEERRAYVLAQVESGQIQLPDLTLAEINEEIRLAREERAAKEK